MGHKKGYQRPDKLEHNLCKVERVLSQRKAVFSLYGNRCQICNEKEFEFLSIDHVHNDGYKYRKIFKSDKLTRSIIDGSLKMEDHRLLCRNCNSGGYIGYVNNKNCVSTYEHLDEVCDVCYTKNMFLRPMRNRKNDIYKIKICLNCKRFKRKELKNQVFRLLGGQCSCCSIEELDNLNVDHIHNDGHIERLVFHSGSALYDKILKGTVDIARYQLLCWNCNYSKHLGKGVCIHKRRE